MSNNGSVLCRATVMYSYQARPGRPVKEIDIEKGQEVLVFRKYRTGWWMGEVVGGTGERGVFPGSYVRELTDDPAAAATSSGSVASATSAAVASGASGPSGSLPQATSSGSSLSGSGKAPLTASSAPLSTSAASSSTAITATTSSMSAAAQASQKMSPMATVVIEAFTPTQQGQLVLRVGDQVKVFQKFQSGWWSGEVDGRSGLFPSRCVREQDPSAGANGVSDAGGAELGTDAVAVNTFSGVTAAEVSFRKGQVVRVLGRSSRPGWLNIRAGDRTGIAPENYVRFSDGAAAAPRAEDLERVYAKTAYHAATANELTFAAGDVLLVHERPVGSPMIRGQLVNDPRVAFFPAMLVSSTPPGADDTEKTSQRSARGAATKPISTAEVQFDYNARGNNELSVRKGDVVNILQKMPTGGWWKAEFGGKVGFIPGSYVKEVEAAAAVDAAAMRPAADQPEKPAAAAAAAVAAAPVEIEAAVTTKVADAVAPAAAEDPAASAIASDVSSQAEPEVVTESKAAKEPVAMEKCNLRAVGMHNYTAQVQSCLSFEKGTEMVIIRKPTGNSQWYVARIGDKKGHVPISYVRLADDSVVDVKKPVRAKAVKTGTPSKTDKASSPTAGTDSSETETSSSQSTQPISSSPARPPPRSDKPPGSAAAGADMVKLLGSMQSMMNDLKMQFAKRQSDQLSALQDMRSEIGRMKTVMDQLTQEKTAMAGEIKELRAALVAAQDNARATAMQVESLGAKVTALQAGASAAAATAGRMDAVEKDVSSCLSNLSTEIRERRDLDSTVRRLQGMLESMKHGSAANVVREDSTEGEAAVADNDGAPPTRRAAARDLSI